MHNSPVDLMFKSWVLVGALVLKNVHNVGVNNLPVSGYTSPAHSFSEAFYTTLNRIIPSVNLTFCTQSPVLINKTNYLIERI